MVSTKENYKKVQIIRKNCVFKENVHCKIVYGRDSEVFIIR